MFKLDHVPFRLVIRVTWVLAISVSVYVMWSRLWSNTDRYFSTLLWCNYEKITKGWRAMAAYASGGLFCSFLTLTSLFPVLALPPCSSSSWLPSQPSQLFVAVGTAGSPFLLLAPLPAATLHESSRLACPSCQSHVPLVHIVLLIPLNAPSFPWCPYCLCSVKVSHCGHSQ